MRGRMRVRVLLTTLLFALALGAYYYINTQRNDPLDVIRIIQKSIDPKDGSIKDYVGDIKFKGPDSVGYELVSDNNIRIHFGDLQFDMSQEDLLNDKLVASLGAIGITIDVNKKTNKYIVKYKGEPVSLYGRNAGRD